MRLSIIVLLAFVVIAISCSRSVDVNRINTYPFVHLNECTNWSFKYNQGWICLTGIIEDSRCPSDVVCIWQGEATATFRFTENGNSHDLTLSPKSSPSPFPSDTTVAGYKIEFINLYPY